MYKIVAIENGKVTTRFPDKASDAALVLWVLRLSKVRCGIRELSKREAQAQRDKEAATWAGDGI